MSASRAKPRPATKKGSAAAAPPGDSAASGKSGATSGKSGARNWFLAKYAAEATLEGDAFEASRAATVCVIDGSQALKALNGERNTPTLRIVQHAMSNEARHAFRTLPQLNTVVLCFDRYPRVALCKDVEHAARNRAGSGGGVPPGFALGGLDDLLDDGFQAVLHDRHVWTPRLVSWLCKQWCSTPECAPDYLRREGQRLVIDGHCLTYGDLPGVAVHPDAPLVLTRSDGAIKVDFLDGLAHLHGEGDLAMLYLLQELAPNNAAVLLYSVDSDLMWYLLRLLEKSSKHFELFMRYRPGLSWCVSSNTNPDIRGSATPQTWIHINRLKVAVQSFEPLRKLPLEHRVGVMVVLAACAGNDFVDSLYRVPVHHFFKAYFNNMEYIGDLVEGDKTALRVDPAALARLTECAVEQSHLRGSAYIAGKSAKKKPASDRLPGETGLAYRALHLDLYLRIMDSIGEPVFKEPLLCHFGYARKDRSRPVGRGNLIRLHGEEEPDEWEFQGHLPPLAERGVRG